MGQYAVRFWDLESLKQTLSIFEEYWRGREPPKTSLLLHCFQLLCVAWFLYAPEVISQNPKYRCSMGEG